MAYRTWEFSVQRERVEDALVVSLKGRLGSAVVHLLDDALTIPEDVAVVVDLEALDYISGPGLEAVGAAARRAADEHRDFVVCGLQGSVHTCFHLTGLLSILVVEPDRKTAIARIAKRTPST